MAPALASAAACRSVTPELRFLGAGSAAGLAAVDIVYAGRGRIAHAYLIDAAIQLALIARGGQGGLTAPHRHLAYDGASARSQEWASNALTNSASSRPAPSGASTLRISNAVVHSTRATSCRTSPIRSRARRPTDRPKQCSRED